MQQRGYTSPPLGRSNRIRPSCSPPAFSSAGDNSIHPIFAAKKVSSTRGGTLPLDEPTSRVTSSTRCRRRRVDIGASREEEREKERGGGEGPSRRFLPNFHVVATLEEFFSRRSIHLSNCLRRDGDDRFRIFVKMKIVIRANVNRSLRFPAFPRAVFLVEIGPILLLLLLLSRVAHENMHELFEIYVNPVGFRRSRCRVVPFPPRFFSTRTDHGPPPLPPLGAVPLSRTRRDEEVETSRG